jgi:hypothetical protein
MREELFPEDLSPSEVAHVKRKRFAGVTPPQYAKAAGHSRNNINVVQLTKPTGSEGGPRKTGPQKPIA